MTTISKRNHFFVFDDVHARPNTNSVIPGRQNSVSRTVEPISRSEESNSLSHQQRSLSKKTVQKAPFTFIVNRNPICNLASGEINIRSKANNNIPKIIPVSSCRRDVFLSDSVSSGRSSISEDQSTCSIIEKVNMMNDVSNETLKKQRTMSSSILPDDLSREKYNGEELDNNDDNSDTEFDLDPLPERDERFWMSTNDLCNANSLSQPKRMTKSRKISLRNAAQLTAFAACKTIRGKRGHDDDSSSTSSSVSTQARRPGLLDTVRKTPLSLLRSKSQNVSSGSATSTSSADERGDHDGTRKKISSFATVRRRLVNPRILVTSVNNESNKPDYSLNKVTKVQNKQITAVQESGVALNKPNRTLSLPEKVWNELIHGGGHGKKSGLFFRAGSIKKNRVSAENLSCSESVKATACRRATMSDLTTNTLQTDSLCSISSEDSSTVEKYSSGVSSSNSNAISCKKKNKWRFLPTKFLSLERGERNAKEEEDLDFDHPIVTLRKKGFKVKQRPVTIHSIESTGSSGVTGSEGTSEDAGTETESTLKRTSKFLWKSLGIQKKNKVANGSDLEEPVDEPEDFEVSENSESERRGRSWVRRNRSSKTKSSTIFSTFYHYTGRGNKKFCVKELDDVTLDLSNGELRKTEDGTVIVQTDMILPQVKNSTSHVNSKSRPRTRSPPATSNSRIPVKTKNASASEDVDNDGNAKQRTDSSSNSKGLLGLVKGGFRSNGPDSGSPRRNSQGTKGTSKTNGETRSVTGGNGSFESSGRNDAWSHPHHRSQTYTAPEENEITSSHCGGGRETKNETNGFGSVKICADDASNFQHSSEEELTSINIRDLPRMTRVSQDKCEDYNGPFDGRAVAIADSTPSPYDQHALRYKKGEIINIISKKPTGLWTGMVNNQVGHFKFINVQILPESDDEGEYAETGNDDSHSPDDPESEDQIVQRQQQPHSLRHRRNKRSGPMSPWEMEQRQTVANVINGIRKENSALSQQLAQAESPERAFASEKVPHTSPGLNQNGAEQKSRRDKDSRKKSSSLKKGRPKSVGDLLQRINLEEHISVFILQGFDTLDLFKELEEEDLDRLAIVHAEDRTKLLTAVELLRDFDSDDEIPPQNLYYGSTYGGSEIDQSHSVQKPTIAKSTPGSRFSCFPRDSGIFVGKYCEHEESCCSDKDPEVESDEIILSAVNLQKASAMQSSFGHDMTHSTAMNKRSSLGGIPVLQHNSKKGTSRVLSRNSIVNNAIQINSLENVCGQTVTALSTGKGAQPVLKPISGETPNFRIESGKPTERDGPSSIDSDAYRDVSQRFHETRLFFQSQGFVQTPKTFDDSKSKLHSNKLNRFLQCEKSSDSGISVSTSTGSPPPPPPPFRIG